MIPRVCLRKDSKRSLQTDPNFQSSTSNGKKKEIKIHKTITISYVLYFQRSDSLRKCGSPKDVTLLQQPFASMSKPYLHLLYVYIIFSEAKARHGGKGESTCPPKKLHRTYAALCPYVSACVTTRPRQISNYVKFRPFHRPTPSSIPFR